MEHGDWNLLVKRIADEGFEIDFDPRGDGTYFYAAAGYPIGLSASIVQDTFDFLRNNRYNVSIYPLNVSN